MLERLFLKSPIQRTSQRVKRTSANELCCDSLDRSLDRLVASLDRLLGRSIARSIARSNTRSLARSRARSLDRSLDRCLVRSVAHSMAGSLARSLADELSTGDKFRNVEMFGNYLVVRISNYWRAPYVFLKCPNSELFFVGFTFEHVYCFGEYLLPCPSWPVTCSSLE